MTILDLTARLAECHDCGARIDARGVFCLDCITADERRRLTAAKGGDGEGRGTANSEAPSPSFGEAGCSSFSSASSAEAGFSTLNATTRRAVNTAGVKTTTA